MLTRFKQFLQTRELSGSPDSSEQRSAKIYECIRRPNLCSRWAWRNGSPPELGREISEVEGLTHSSFRSVTVGVLKSMLGHFGMWDDMEVSNLISINNYT